MKHFFSSLPHVTLALFTRFNLFWNFAAIVVTYALVTTNVDWYYFLHTRQDILRPLFSPALFLGAVLPVVVPLVFIAGGYAWKNKTILVSGWTLAQAVFLGSIISSTYKAFTGRIQPNIHDLTNNISANFDFGFWNHGIFWGWPSSHTTIAFAAAFALIELHPKNKIVHWASILYALYIGIGVSFSVHWFSDFVGGAIIGTIIGIAVGRNFRHYLHDFLKEK